MPGLDVMLVKSCDNPDGSNSYYPNTQAGQANEVDSFQDFMSQVEELDNLDEFQVDLNNMGVLSSNMAHFKS